ncbi:circularly permuted type 2 ATP-grasp protein [Geodermatophilus sp. YIM 151500]|uniref:circularly permuted type 2 ATP-grasp protein n=1 Tax=Geodermatophilus sp. YIM 151500 TaxID=2984531 RepID=UPI0021E3A377|nr:circularly permuted type 2 ATP-grasp protein [Geodermatophilus sp. YIM 151500]MCV2489635.1 circularly permuted type 2 ATP-grasp protein [Geodermatophilus sp. YIM 151500]
MSSAAGLFAGYPGSDADELVGPDGRLRAGGELLGPVLERLGTAGLLAAAAALAAEGRARGPVVGSWTDGQRSERVVPLDPVPRVLHAAEWARLAAGVEQRHRALNAFLADVYRAAGRRRGDPDREPGVVRAGVLPGWVVAHSPGRDPGAVGLAWTGQARAALAAVDVVRTAAGTWTVRGDSLRVPSGLGLALSARARVRAAAPELLPAAVRPADPGDAVPLLAAALAATAPPACAGEPRIAVLSAGRTDGHWSEHRLLAEALGAPLVQAGDLWPRVDGGIAATVDGDRLPVDVLYRRFDDAELGAHRTPAGPSLTGLLAEAVRAGRLGLANVPGNAVADDAVVQCFVPAMIEHYLGERPLLSGAPTWVLADPAQWAQVRDRLHELVLTPLDAYGGGRVVAGPDCSAAELAELQAEVAAAPHRFVARDPVRATTLPTVVDGRLEPRAVDLRVLSVATPDGVRALPAPLTRVAAAGSPETDVRRGGGTKDTWLVP